MKEVVIKSEVNKRYCISLIEKLTEDGSVTVVIKKTKKDSTAAQRSLKWLWNTEIAQSGIGQDDTAQDVHTRNKMMFGHPIKMRDALLQDADFYPELYTTFTETYKNHPAYPQMMRFFAENHIKTERFTRQQNAEYLKNVQQYWIGKGVNLTDPALKGLDDWLGYKPKDAAKCKK